LIVASQAQTGVDGADILTAEELANLRSLGLLDRRERAFLLGGEFTLEGKARQGTTVTVQIPRRQAKAQGGAQ
jgi:signal transduction histidine kinase